MKLGFGLPDLETPKGKTLDDLFNDMEKAGMHFNPLELADTDEEMDPSQKPQEEKPKKIEYLNPEPNRGKRLRMYDTSWFDSLIPLPEDCIQVDYWKGNKVILSEHVDPKLKSFISIPIGTKRYDEITVITKEDIFPLWSEKTGVFVKQFKPQVPKQNMYRDKELVSPFVYRNGYTTRVLVYGAVNIDNCLIA